MRMRILAAMAIALLISIVGASDLRAECYSLVGQVHAEPDLDPNLIPVDPNLSVGRIDGFIDPITNVRHSVTVMFKASWLKCSEPLTYGAGRPYAWSAWMFITEQYADWAVAERQTIQYAHPFLLAVKQPPPPSDMTEGPQVTNGPIKWVVVWFDIHTAWRTGSTF